MDHLDLKEAKRKVERPKHRNFSSIIRPFMWFGAFIGAMPYTAQRSPDNVAEGGSARVTYKFSSCSFPFFITLVWVLTTILYHVTVPFNDPYHGTEEYSFLIFLNYLTTLLYLASYGPLCLMLYRASRLTSLINSMAEVDDALPSSGLGTCLAVAGILGLFILRLVLGMLFELYVECSSQAVPHSLALTHVKLTAPSYFMLMCTFAAHLAQKFEALNGQVVEAVQWKDVARLAHLRHLHQRLRSLVQETEATFWPLITPTYLRMMLTLCMLIVQLDIYSSLNYKRDNFWIFGLLNIVYYTEFITIHLLPNLCSTKAGSTVHQLEGHNYEDEALSRQVGRWRSELVSTRVYFTAGLMELTMPGLYTDLQFMITLFVVLIQFTRESAVSSPINLTHT